MTKLSKKATESIAAGLKRSQPILSAAKSRDINDSDTVVLVAHLCLTFYAASCGASRPTFALTRKKSRSR